MADHLLHRLGRWARAWADNLDIDPMVDQQGCGRLYAQLEECLGEHDRDWRRCQSELKAFRGCYDASNKGER